MYWNTVHWPFGAVAYLSMGLMHFHRLRILRTFLEHCTSAVVLGPESIKKRWICHFQTGGRPRWSLVAIVVDHFLNPEEFKRLIIRPAESEPIQALRYFLSPLDQMYNDH